MHVNFTVYLLELELFATEAGIRRTKNELCTSRLSKVIVLCSLHKTDTHADRRPPKTLPRRLVGCVAQMAERRSLAGKLTLSCTRPVADG